MKKSILVWFALLATMMTAHATAVYEAKALMTPQVRAYAFAPLDSVQQHTIKVDLDKFIEIPDGATVTLNDTLRRFGEPGNDLINDVLKVVLPVILAIATIGLAFMMLNTVMSTPMGATQTVWRDAEGGIHNNSVDCDSANRRIAERRAGGM